VIDEDELIYHNFWRSSFAAARNSGFRRESLSHGERGPIGSPSPAATVFVVDDAVSVRESLEVLIRCERWQPARTSPLAVVGLLLSAIDDPVITRPLTTTGMRSLIFIPK